MLEKQKHFEQNMMKRVEANDPVAMREEGMAQYGKGNYIRAFECHVQAAELGDAEAHYQLALMFYHGIGVEKDEGKEIYHLEEAAIGGNSSARHRLGCEEWSNDNFERAVRHWTIAAAQGLDKSMKILMDVFQGGLVSKEVLAATRRAHQAAVDSMKSPQREAAKELERMRDNSL